MKQDFNSHYPPHISYNVESTIELLYLIVGIVMSHSIIFTEAEAAVAEAAVAEAAAAMAAAEAMIAEAEAEALTVVVMEDQIIQIRNMEPISVSEASIAEYGVDYSTESDTQELIKFEVWVDAEGLTNGATEIKGYEFNIDWDTADVEGLGVAFLEGDLIGATYNTSVGFNSTTGSVYNASSSAIVDTDPNNNLVFNGNIQSEKLVATFYMNPTDASAETIILTMTNMLVATDADNITPDDYTYYALDYYTSELLAASANAETAAELLIEAEANMAAAALAAPYAANDTATTDEDVTTTIDVLSNDTAGDGDVLSVTAATATNGTVSINADGTLTYTGNQDFNGTDAITYTINDGYGGTDTATVEVTVNSINDTPTLINVIADAVTDEDSAYSYDASANFTDVDANDVLTYSAALSDGSMLPS